MSAFDKTWPLPAIPGEYDSMDQTDRERWRGVIQQAFDAGHLAARQLDFEIQKKLEFDIQQLTLEVLSLRKASS